MIYDRRFFLALLVVAAIALVVMPLLFDSDDLHAGRRREQIAAMTAAERERLERNFTQFVKLSEAERAHFRRIDSALAKDRDQGRGRLNAALDVFLDWLQSMPPYQRDELQREQDPVAKIALIRQVLEEQREVRLEGRLGQRIEARIGPLPILKQQDLEAVTSVLTEETAWPAVAAEELDGYQGLRKSLKLFEVLGRRNRELSDSLTNRRMQDLLDAISDEPARQMLETDAAGQPAAWNLRRRKMALTLWKNLELALDREARRRRPTQRALTEFFMELPEVEQEALLESSAARFRGDLARRYVESESDDRIEMRAVRRFLLPGGNDRLRDLGSGRSSSANGRFTPATNRQRPPDANSD